MLKANIYFCLACAFRSKGDYSNGMFAWGKKFNTLTKILSHLHMVKAHDLRAPWRNSLNFVDEKYIFVMGKGMWSNKKRSSECTEVKSSQGWRMINIEVIFFT